MFERCKRKDARCKTQWHWRERLNRAAQVAPSGEVRARKHGSADGDTLPERNRRRMPTPPTLTSIWSETRVVKRVAREHTRTCIRCLAGQPYCWSPQRTCTTACCNLAKRSSYRILSQAIYNTGNGSNADCHPNCSGLNLASLFLM